MEREQRSWRAGYVIVPVAILVGSLQLFIPSASHRGGGWSQDQRQETGASQPRQLTQSSGRSAELQRPSLSDSRPLASSNPADEATATAPTPIRIFIHHTAGDGNALPAIQLAAVLQVRGFDVVDIRPVDFQIEQPSVRYFFDGDRRESRRLVEAIGAFYAEDRGPAPGEATDFSNFSPKPRRGNVEVWLPARAAGENRST